VRGTTAVGITTPPRLVGGRSRAIESLMIDGVVLGSVLEVQDDCCGAGRGALQG
jgi:hypothetical protein